MSSNNTNCDLMIIKWFQSEYGNRLDQIKVYSLTQMIEAPWKLWHVPTQEGKIKLLYRTSWYTSTTDNRYTTNTILEPRYYTTAATVHGDKNGTDVITRDSLYKRKRFSWQNSGARKGEAGRGHIVMSHPDNRGSKKHNHAVTLYDWEYEGTLLAEWKGYKSSW